MIPLYIKKTQILPTLWAAQYRSVKFLDGCKLSQ